MKRTKESLALLLQCFEKGFPSKNFVDPKNIKKLLPEAMSIAKENGLLYPFSQELAKSGVDFPKELSLEVAKEEQKLLVFKKTLTTLKQVFESADLDLLFIKLYRGVQYVPRDVDILVKVNQLQQSTLAMRKAGFNLTSYQGVENEIRKEGLLKVDLYQDFRYLSARFMDQDFLWKNQRQVDIFGVKCNIPSLAADLVSLSIHDLLGHRYLSLLDFLYADDLLNNRQIDIGEAVRQTKNHQWNYAFNYFISLIKELRGEINSDVSNISFPYRFSAKQLLTAFESFSCKDVSEQRKLFFIMSTLADSVLFYYTILSRKTSKELSQGTRSNMLKPLHKLRHWEGDTKLSIQG